MATVPTKLSSSKLEAIHLLHSIKLQKADLKLIEDSMFCSSKDHVDHVHFLFVVSNETLLSVRVAGPAVKRTLKFTAVNCRCD